MSGLYVKLDVEYASDDKLIEAGPMAELLYVRSLAFCKKNPQSDGKISAAHLAVVAVGIPGPKRLAARLVEVGAWRLTGKGWEISAWLKRNRSAADIQAQQDMASALGIRGNHDRWHTGPDGKPSPKCPICIGTFKQTRSQTPSGNPIETDRESDNGLSPKEEEEEETEEKPETEPEPQEETEPSSLSSAVKLTLVPTEPHDDDRIEQAIELHARHASQGKKTGYAVTIRANDPIEHGPTLRAYLERWPDATPAELAAMVLGVPIEGPLPDRRPPPPEYPHCDECEDAGWKTVWATNNDGHEYSPGVEPCHCPRGQALQGTA